MKKKSIAILAFMVILAIALNYVAFFGFTAGPFATKVAPAPETTENADNTTATPAPVAEKTVYSGMFDEQTGIKKGIDLAGGSVITFEAVAENPTEEEMKIVETIFSTRLTNAGYTEARISRSEAKKITVEIPSVFDTDSAAGLLGTTAKLSFTDAQGNVVLESSDIKDAVHKYGQTNQASPAEDYIEITFASSAVSKFADATRAAAAMAASGQNYIAIMMDDQMISAPRVSQEINSETCVISGSFDAASAEMLANQIKSGKLPFNLTVISQDTVGAELGSKALPTSILAAGIGLLIIMIFMVIMYRIPGLIADLALLIYVGIMCLILGAFHINLSLSGIAGIILSIGMAVDANVIIFERMKEEMKLGKTIRASVESGFSKAFSAIFDSNITTIITCVVLYMSGIGTITGFAVTLGIGVVVSMFTAIVITKFLLKQLVRLNISNRKLFIA